MSSDVTMLEEVSELFREAAAFAASVAGLRWLCVPS